jgi:hypothetical protein
LTLGLGQANKADVIGIRWPSRKVTELKDVAANQILVVDEEKGGGGTEVLCTALTKTFGAGIYSAIVLLIH